MESCRQRRSFWLLLVFCACLSVYFSWFTILRHYRLESREFDLGVLSNVIANTGWGHIFRSSYYHGNSFLGVHVVPLYLLLAPIYRIFPHIETLLILQALAVVLAAPVLFVIAKRLGLGYPLPLVCALIYLAHPANQSALFYDFHELAFFPLAFFIYVLCLVSGARKEFSLAALALCLAVKEDIAVIVLFSLWMLAPFAGRMTALRHGGICVLWYLATVIIREATGGAAHPYTWYYRDLLAPGTSGVWGMLLGIAQDPWYFVSSRFTASRGLYVLLLMAPVGFVPFTRRAFFLAVVPGFLMTLLAGGRKYELYTISFQYVWYILPAAFTALVLLAGSQTRIRPVVLAVAVLMSIYEFSVFGAWPGNQRFAGGYHAVRFSITARELERRENLLWLSDAIPRNEWAVCSSDVCAQLQSHMKMESCRMWHDERKPRVRWGITGESHYCPKEMFRERGFVLLDKRDGFYLWHRK